MQEPVIPSVICPNYRAMHRWRLSLRRGVEGHRMGMSYPSKQKAGGSARSSRVVFKLYGADVTGVPRRRRTLNSASPTGNVRQGEVEKSLSHLEDRFRFVRAERGNSHFESVEMPQGKKRSE